MFFTVRAIVDAVPGANCWFAGVQVLPTCTSGATGMLTVTSAVDVTVGAVDEVAVAMFGTAMSLEAQDGVRLCGAFRETVTRYVRPAPMPTPPASSACSKVTSSRQFAVTVVEHPVSVFVAGWEAGVTEVPRISKPSNSAGSGSTSLASAQSLSSQPIWIAYWNSSPLAIVTAFTSFTVFSSVSDASAA